VPLRAALAAVVIVVGTAACGSGGGSKATTTVPTSSTTTPKPVANIEVRPAQGQVGTSFTLIGTGFRPGETVTFDVVFPDNRAPFKGQPHKTTPDGAVQTTYRATAGNPAGTYKVQATGDQGTTGEATFTLGGSGATATTKAATTATTRAATTATTKAATPTTRY
jgi:hypothetical protein